MKRGRRMLDATAHFEAVHDLLPGGAEVFQARKTALARAEQSGLPTRRNENWHYTDLARLLKHSVRRPCAILLMQARLRFAIGV